MSIPKAVTYTKGLKEVAKTKGLCLITIDTPELQIQQAVTKAEAKALERTALAMLAEHRAKSSPSTS